MIYIQRWSRVLKLLYAIAFFGYIATAIIIGKAIFIDWQTISIVNMIFKLLLVLQKLLLVLVVSLHSVLLDILLERLTISMISTYLKLV